MTRVYDVAVVGGGPAGASAALWSARYRRRVVLIDAGQQRNRWASESHGYIGFDGAPPGDLIDAARRDLAKYEEIDVLEGRRAVRAARRAGGAVRLTLDDGVVVDALRLVLATGVRDVFPDVPEFEEFYGRSIFTCPSCDGYAARDKAVAVVGDSTEMAEFALGMLDWAGSVVAIRESPHTSSLTDAARRRYAVDDVVGRVIAIEGETASGQVRALVLDDGRRVACDVAFWLMRHEQQSDLARQLGCEVSSERCLTVDEHGATTVAGVYAAGDITPGPHLVQVAAAEGARAGIAAATSLRGHHGAPASPVPAPDPTALVDEPS